MKRKIVTVINLVMLLVTCNSPQEKNLPQLVTVKQVDLNKYIGLWYEISKILNSFQDQCDHGTTAEYRIDED
jgi:lipocalin